MRDNLKASAVAVITAASLMLASLVARAEMPVSTNEAVCWIGNGSGTLVGVTADQSKALVISCWHCCKQKGRIINCTFKNVPHLAAKKFPGRVTRVDSKWDLAAILIYNPGIPPVVIGDLQRHQGLYSACGYGGGRYSAARGSVYSFDSSTTWTRCGIYPGHSGGGLFDPFGGYCGVTNWNNGSNGPNPRGWSRSRSGDPLKKFIHDATYECGIFSRWRNKGGGHGTCPPGGCPPEGGAAPGSGYGLAPGYKPLTPLAGQTPIAVIPQTPQAAPQVAPPVVADPYNPPAPVPDAVVVTPAKPTPAEPQEPSNVEPPWELFAQQIEAAENSDRREAAAKAAYAAYKAAMTGAQERSAIARSVVSGPGESDAKGVVDRLPEVSVVVRYSDRTEEAKIDLANCFRNLIGVGGEAEHE